MSEEYADEAARSDRLRTGYVGGIGSEYRLSSEAHVYGVIRHGFDWLSQAVDRNLRVLSPPESLLEPFGNVQEAAERDGHPEPRRAAWETVSFRQRYLQHLERSDAQATIKCLRGDLNAGETIWLVGLTASETFSHRRLLAATIRCETPTHWTELHDPAEDDTDAQGSLSRFSGGGSRA